MKMLITGSNLFGQWQVGTCILDNFQTKMMGDEDKIIFNDKSELVHVSWSYNIFRTDDKFYVSGTWKGKDNQVAQIKLPQGCEKNIGKLTMVGNDYSILVIDIITPMIWILDLENDSFKKINFVTEMPLDNITLDAKRQKQDSSVKKVMITNISGLFLTAGGLVYWGILPTLLDTRQCEGKVIDVQCGYQHFMLLTDVGKVYTWGDGRRLQLGHDDLISLELPTLVKALDGIKITKIRAGGWHSLALSEFGDLYAWGWNDIGQLGIRNTADSSLKSESLPALVDFYDNDSKVVSLNVKDIACGTRHSAALLEDYSLWTAGNNEYGQCGFKAATQPMVKHFKKAYQCESGHTLFGGPWATVVI